MIYLFDIFIMSRSKIRLMLFQQYYYYSVSLYGQIVSLKINILSWKSCGKDVDAVRTLVSVMNISQCVCHKRQSVYRESELHQGMWVSATAGIRLPGYEFNMQLCTYQQNVIWGSGLRCFLLIFFQYKVSLCDRLDPYLGPTDKFSYGLLTIYGSTFVWNTFPTLKRVSSYRCVTQERGV